MICKSRAELPAEYACLQCNATKPIAEMMLVHRKKTRDFRLRPRCKDCHNKREKGHRRDYKTRYLRRWRKENANLNESYWRQRNAELRAELSVRARKRFTRNHAAILIQGRLRRQLGMHVTLTEARALCRKYGRCYPTRYGLSKQGLLEAERIRSRMRRSGNPYSLVEIRMMVYEEAVDDTLVKIDGKSPRKFLIEPKMQKQPYQRAARQLREWHKQQRKIAA
jgi:hypothetical protein